MKSRQVIDLMAPVFEYEVINENLRIPEAISMLEKAMDIYAEKKFFHESVLVEDNDGIIKGKLSCFDIVKALEPKYSRTGDSDQISKFGVSHFGLSPDYVKAIVSRYDLWDESLEVMIRNSSAIRVKDIMYKPLNSGHVFESSTLADAIHQIVMGHQTSLLVLNDGGEITGILRLKDIFKEVCFCL